MRRIRAAGLAGLAVVGLAACSGGSTGPTYPSIAGTYNATYQVEASTNGPPTLVDNLGAIAGTITLSGASSNGDFSGSYIAGNTSGVITGQEQTDGGVQISQFGNPNESAYEGLLILENEFPGCDFSVAGIGGMSGEVAGANLTLTQTTALPCNWTDSQGNFYSGLASNITLTIDGVR